MPLTRPRPRHVGVAVAALVASLSIGGCVRVAEERSRQLDVIGDVEVSTTMCPDFMPDVATLELCDPYTGATRRARTTLPDRAQLLVAWRIPETSAAPDTVPAARDDGTASGVYRASPSYTAELERLHPTGDDARWVGYRTDTLDVELGEPVDWTATARFALPRTAAGEPFRGPFPFRTVSGHRSAGAGDAAVDCAAAGTECVSGEGRDRTQATRDLAVAAAGTPPRIAQGMTGNVPFVLRFAGAASDEAVFALSAATPLAGADARPASAAFVPAADSETPMLVTVAVPAQAAPGMNEVELVARLANGQERRGTAQYEVVAAGVPLEEERPGPERPAPARPGPSADATPPVGAERVESRGAEPPREGELPRVAARSVSLLPAARRCVSRRAFTIRVRRRSRERLVAATVDVNGLRVRTLHGARITAPVVLTGLPRGRFAVRITARTSDGRTLTGTRRYWTCRPRLPGGVPRL
jgi:hypothetical protein